MQPLVQETLDEFINQGIIVPVEEPTDWISSLAYSWKANGKLQVCQEPKDLNTAIRCDHYKIPNMEEITHELAGSTCFTMLNETSSYLCIVLDYESSLLMTFNTPWGRFRFVCLPWGLACAQDIFQWMMDQILTLCDGVIGIADDVVFHGKNDKEHDKHLHKFIRVTCAHGLAFNTDMCAVKQTSVVFLGCVYDANGAYSDPKKGHCRTRDASTQDINSTTEVPQIGNLPITLHTITLLFPCTPTWAAEEMNRVHLEQLLSGSI